MSSDGVLVWEMRCIDDELILRGQTWLDVATIDDDSLRAACQRAA